MLKVLVYETYAEKKNSLIVRELTSSSNRFIAICRYNFNQKNNIDNLLNHLVIIRGKNESE